VHYHHGPDLLGLRFQRNTSLGLFVRGNPRVSDSLHSSRDITLAWRCKQVTDGHSSRFPSERPSAVRSRIQTPVRVVASPTNALASASVAADEGNPFTSSKISFSVGARWPTEGQSV
jgi:hypothetical protein